VAIHGPSDPWSARWGTKRVPQISSAPADDVCDGRCVRSRLGEGRVGDRIQTSLGMQAQACQERMPAAPRVDPNSWKEKGQTRKRIRRLRAGGVGLIFARWGRERVPQISDAPADDVCDGRRVRSRRWGRIETSLGMQAQACKERMRAAPRVDPDSGEKSLSDVRLPHGGGWSNSVRRGLFVASTPLFTFSKSTPTGLNRNARGRLGL
jgi:copper binding octapeptide repeat protein